MLAGSRGFGSRNTTFQNSLVQKSQAFNALSPFGQMGGAQEGSKLKEIRQRMKSVKSIEKITKTMKMIASSRLKAAQVRMEKNKAFFAGASKILNVIPADLSGKNLIIPVSADRGLCGAINSTIIKGTKSLLNSRASAHPNAEFKIVTLGDKAIQGISRDQPDKVGFHVTEISKKPFTFAGASVVAEKIMHEITFDSVTVYHNKFISAISYGQDSTNIPSAAQLANRKEIYDYEFEEEDRLFHLPDLVEFELASTIFHAYCESTAAELGARMSAMDSATRNAQDMLKNLNIAFNRGRQAAITTELNEIISGASAIQ